MKKIEPVLVWKDGEQKTAKFLYLLGVEDNYIDSARIYYSLDAGVLNEDDEEIPGQKLVEGNLTIKGVDYQNWGNEPADEINQWIYDWAAEQLNLTLV